MVKHGQQWQNVQKWSNMVKMVKNGLSPEGPQTSREQFEKICSTGIFVNPSVRPRPARSLTLATSSSGPAMYSSSNVGQISFSYLLCDQNLIPAMRSPSNFGQLSLPFLLCCVDANTKNLISMGFCNLESCDTYWLSIL